jgi:hypothetical protein
MILMKRWTIVGCVLVGMFFVTGCRKPPKPQDTPADDGTTSIHDVSIADDVEVEEIKAYIPAAGEPKSVAGGKGSRPPAKKAVVGAATPKAVLDNISKATLAGDKVTFLRNVDATPQEKPVVGAMVDAAFAMAKFREAVEKQYGKDSLKAGGVGMFTVPLPTFSTEDNFEIEEEGNSAVATITGVEGGATTTTAVQFVKKGGRWLMKLDKIPAGPERDKTLKTMRTLKTTAEKYGGMVGQPEQTAKKILEGFSQEMKTMTSEAAGADEGG